MRQLTPPIRPPHNTATVPYHGNAFLAEGYSGIKVRKREIIFCVGRNFLCDIFCFFIVLNRVLSWFRLGLTQFKTDDNDWAPGDVLYGYFGVKYVQINIWGLIYLSQGCFSRESFDDSVVVCQAGGGGWFNSPYLFVWLELLQSVNQSVSRSVYQTVGQSVSQSVSQSFSQSVGQTLTQPLSQSESQTVSQSNSQSVSQSISHSTNIY